MDQVRRVLEAIGDGDYQITLHARQRMAWRSVAHEDIRSCGVTGTAALQASGKIQVQGYDCDGEELKLICVEEDGVLIVTVF
jgi:hypothetical protein